MKQILRDLAENLGGRPLGEGSVTVSSVSSLQSATGESLVFVEDTKHLDAGLKSSAAAVIAGQFAAALDAARKPILISTQPRLTFARAAQLLRDSDNNRAIHPRPLVSFSTRIATDPAIC